MYPMDALDTRLPGSQMVKAMDFDSIIEGSIPSPAANMLHWRNGSAADL